MNRTDRLLAIVLELQGKGRQRARVLEPESLCRRLAEEAEAMLKHYT